MGSRARLPGQGGHPAPSPCPSKRRVVPSPPRLRGAGGRPLQQTLGRRGPAAQCPPSRVGSVNRAPTGLGADGTEAEKASQGTEDRPSRRPFRGQESAVRTTPTHSRPERQGRRGCALPTLWSGLSFSPRRGFHGHSRTKGRQQTHFLPD